MEATDKTVPTVRVKPELIELGKRQVISTGRWNHGCMTQYVLENGHRHITIGELAKVLGANTLGNRARVRRHLPGLFRYILDTHRQLLVIEYENSHNRSEAVKLFDPAAEDERNKVMVRLQRMVDRCDMTVDVYTRAHAIVSAGPSDDEAGKAA
jgi:hypothetical protein